MMEILGISPAVVVERVVIDRGYRGSAVEAQRSGTQR